MSAGAAFASSFNNIFSQINSVTGKAIYLNDWTVFESIESEDETTERMEGFETIEFQNVSYKYPNASVPALRNISCQIKRGNIIALVGENGSGKTTFSKLILGALTPSEGNILVNNKPLSALLQEFRKKISYVPQNYGTFKMTLEDNLKLGNNNIDLETYESKFINFSEKLENGYSTPLQTEDKQKEEIFERVEYALAMAGFGILDGDADCVIIRNPATDTDFQIQVSVIE